MTHEYGPIEIITGYSYALIAAGFVLRWAIAKADGKRAELLWPIMLMSIFALCGATRVFAFVGFAPHELVQGAFHLILATISLLYAIGQLLFACWPGLFELDTDLPKFTSDYRVQEETPVHPAHAYFDRP